ncbi:hypothetical protein KGK29_004571 [Salmonella enterica]|nr:hypothetical protein [Salmonella enterica]
MNKLLIAAAMFFIPATGFCAGTPVTDADSAAIAIKNQQLLIEQLQELKLIRQELQTINQEKGKKDTCLYASKPYTDGRQIKDAPLMKNMVCKNNKWVKREESE